MQTISRSLHSINTLLRARCQRGLAMSLSSLLLFVVAIALTSNTLAQPPDLIVANGHLFGADSPTASALAVTGERISAVGDDAQITKLAGPATKRIDAAGGTVMPGLHDAHVHFLSGSSSLSQIDLAGAETLTDIEARILAFIQQHPNDPVFVGRGWLYGSFPGGMPDKQMLDRLIPGRPAIMRCYDGHTVWCNTAALAAAGITRATADPATGEIVRDPVTREPTGVLKEAAQDLIEKVIPKPTRAERLKAVRQGIALAHQLGVTSVCEAGAGLEELDVLETLRAGGELQLRFAIALQGKPAMSEAEIEQLDVLKRRFPNMNIGAVKLYVDGVIESHTAAMLSPYANRATQGLPETSPDELNRVIESLDRRGWQIMVHAIGDGGIRMTLDAFEHAAKSNPIPPQGRRHRLEHIESISQSDIARFGQLGIIASMQPYHANPNSNIFNVWAANLGPDRASRAWVWNSIQQAGGRLAFGSDWPVVSLDPRLGMHTALTRQTLDGKPPQGFIADQCLPLPNVLAAYTSNAAYSQFAETQQGHLKVGQLADIVIWNKNIFNLPVAEVHKAQITKTIFNGKESRLIIE